MDSNNSAVARKNKISEEQKTYLIDFLEQNAELRSGKFTSSFTHKTSQNCWKEIALQLNAVGPVRKDWKQWRKTWQDLKTKTKAKCSELKKHRQKTGGGGEAAPDLSSVEERVLGVIGSVAVSGHPHTVTSNVSFEAVETNENILEDINSDDHNYSVLQGIENFENEVVVVNSQEEVASVLEENTEKILTKRSRLECLDHSSKTNSLNSTSNHFKRKKYVRTQRLDNSIAATNTLAEQMTTKLEMKKNYYDNKLKFMQDANDIQRMIASALESIAQALQ